MRSVRRGAIIDIVEVADYILTHLKDQEVEIDEINLLIEDYEFLIDRKFTQKEKTQIRIDVLLKVNHYSMRKE